MPPNAVYDQKVHVVRIIKDRYKVLTKQVGLRRRDVIRQVCEAHDIEIIQGVVSRDHVPRYISYPPKWSVSEMVWLLKGRSSRRIQEEFPQLGKRVLGETFLALTMPRLARVM